MVEPTGVETSIEMKIPKVAQITDIIAEPMITPRKLLKTPIADSAGKITKADTSNEPTKFIANTIIIAVITAMSKLYLLAFTPVASAKVSSKVTANIL